MLFSGLDLNCDHRCICDPAMTFLAAIVDEPGQTCCRSDHAALAFALKPEQAVDVLDWAHKNNVQVITHPAASGV